MEICVCCAPIPSSRPKSLVILHHQFSLHNVAHINSEWNPSSFLLNFNIRRTTSVRLQEPGGETLSAPMWITYPTHFWANNGTFSSMGTVLQLPSIVFVRPSALTMPSYQPLIVYSMHTLDRCVNSLACKWANTSPEQSMTKGFSALSAMITA